MVAVPTQYQSLVNQAATGTGLPPAVVAAQIQAESGFNPKAVSPTGAEGIFQFEPATYASEGGATGTEFNPTAEETAYVKFMKSLLAWSGGDVQKALAAYNAGQGNWQAGLGYANGILSAAKANPKLTISGSSGASTTAGGGGGSGLLGIPTEIINFFNQANTFVTALMWLASPGSWVRIGAFIVGVALLLFAIHALIAVGEGGNIMPKAPNVIPIPV